MKAVGVIEATPDAIFEHIMSLDSALRYQSMVTQTLYMAHLIPSILRGFMVNGTFFSRDTGDATRMDLTQLRRSQPPTKAGQLNHASNGLI